MSADHDWAEQYAAALIVLSRPEDEIPLSWAEVRHLARCYLEMRKDGHRRVTEAKGVLRNRFTDAVGTGSCKATIQRVE